MQAGLNFNRIYRLTLFYNGRVLMQFSSLNVNDNIDFSCNIVKDGFGNGNSRSTIYLYNLAQQKRNTLESLISTSKTSSMQFMIETGFASQDTTNQNQPLYQVVDYFDVVGAYNELGEADYKTNLILKSGEGSLVPTYSSGSYPVNTALSTILNKECQKLVNLNSITSFIIRDIIDYVFPYGFAYSGNVFDALSKICYETNNSVFVDKGVLIASAQQWINPTNSAPSNLTSFNGLLEAPHIGQNNFTKKYQATQSSVTFYFKALLLPTLNINDVVNVNSQAYTVKRITHSIDSRSGPAYSIIEGFKNGSV